MRARQLHRASAALALCAACTPAAPPVPAAAPPAASATAPIAPQPVATAAPSAAPAAGYAGHGAESVPPEVLARYAAPRLPAELRRRIQAMLDVRAPSAGMVSPDGKSLYFTWTITGIRQVWRLDGPQRFPLQMTGGEDPTAIVGITPDGKTLILSRDRNGEENPGLYLQDAKGGPLVEVQHKKGVQTHAQLVTGDSRWLYYRANDKKNDSYAIYRYDLRTKAREIVFEQEGIWRVADHQDDGRLLLAKDVGSNMTEYFELAPGAKEPRPLFGQGERETYEAAFGAAAGEVLVLTPKLGEFRRLYRWKEGKLTPVTPELEHDVESFSIDHARKRVLYQVNEGGYSRLKALDAKTFREIALPALPPADHVNAGVSTRDGRFTSVAVEAAKSPSTSYVIEWSSGKVTQWHLPGAPEIDTTGFAEARLESYPARDKTPIPMFVRRPAGCAAPGSAPAAGADPCPVIVIFHGGPEAQARAGFNARAQLFVDAGFVVVEPNVRGSDGYGKSWLHADDGPKRLDVITDIEDCARFIRHAWALGGKTPKVGITGGSYGGYSTLVGMTKFAGAYDAGAAIVGMSNLVTFLKNTAPYRRILRISEYGDPGKDEKALLELSPITHLDRVAAPLLVIQGATDPRVPAGESIQIHDALQAKKIPSQLILFADEGHGAQKRDNIVLQTGHVLRFFRQHLLGEKLE